MPKRNYGIINSEFTPLYNEEDFNGACWFNFWAGVVVGALAILSGEIVWMWSLGWL